MITRRRLALAVTLAVAGLGAVPIVGLATSLPQRTFPVSSGPSGPDATVSMDDGSVAYDAGGSVYLTSILTGTSRLVSVGPGGVPANGESGAPVVSADGNVVAFASAATNLTTAAAGPADIYVRSGSNAITDASVAVDGGPANGPCLEPAISADGRYVAFASTASNLVAGDTNGVSDVFVRDLATNTTTRVSVGHGGAQANGPSTMPAISATGNAISFASTASNLVPGDTNGVGDVFLRIPGTDTTDRVSVSTGGTAQNAAVAAPFTQISSVSADGRLVVFDSNATNLVTGEDPRARSNVFLRDRLKHATTLISQSNAGFEGNNDSFAPFITPSGLYVAFESFARNLADGGGPRENVFVRDLNLKTTSVVNATASGRAPGPEIGNPQLGRPTLSGDGKLATFVTSAANLTGSSNGATRAFLRLLEAPRGMLRGGSPAASRHHQVTVTADDPAATEFECRIDLRLPFACRPGRLHLPTLSIGRHKLLVRAGGPGLLYDPLGIRVTLRVTAHG
jgi:Tol biopolymer transport system component